MGQSGWRLPDELLKRVRVHCAQTGERQNVFVEQALESALGPEPPEFPNIAGGPMPLRPLTKKAAKPAGDLPKIAPRRWAK